MSEPAKDPARQAKLTLLASRDAVDTRQQFLLRGGPIDAASCYERTDLSVSGARFKTEAAVAHHSEKIELSLPSDGGSTVVSKLADVGHQAAVLLGRDTKEISVAMSEQDLALAHNGAAVLLLSAEDRIVMVETAVGTTIDGTLATCETGEGSVLLSVVAMSNEASTMVPMRYGDRPDATSTMGLSMLRFIQADGSRGAIAFAGRVDAEAVAAETEAEMEAVAAYTRAAWNRRNPESQGAMVYKPQPMLHKTVMLTDNGVGGSPYKLLSSYVQDQNADPLSMVAIEGLLSAGVGVVLGEPNFGPNTRNLLSGTAFPNFQATTFAASVLTAVPIVVSWLQSYRADGVAKLKASPVSEPLAQVFVPVEHWPNTADVDFPVASGDCDNSAAMSIGFMKRLRDDPILREWMDNNEHRRVDSIVGQDGLPEFKKGDFWFSRALHNAVFPWHIPALGLVGAYGAEATSTKDSSGTSHHERSIVGHAIGLLVPVSQVHTALYSGQVALGGGSEASVAAALSELEERERLFERNLAPHAQTAWRMSMRDERTALPCIPLEGTSPATARFADADKAFAKRASDERSAMRSLPQTTARGWQHLHVNGHDGGHQFYHAVVEATFEPQATVPRQVVLADPPLDAQAAIPGAGACPTSLHFGTYLAVALADETPAQKAILDAASARSRRHRVGVRPESGRVLSASRAAAYEESIQALTALDRQWGSEEQSGSNDAIVTFTIPYNQLVFNSTCVKATAAAMAKAAVGVVDIIPTPDLLFDASGNDIGKCVVISAIPR